MGRRSEYPAVRWTVMRDKGRGISIVHYPIGDEERVVVSGLELGEAKLIVDAHNLVVEQILGKRVNNC